MTGTGGGISRHAHERRHRDLDEMIGADPHMTTLTQCEGRLGLASMQNQTDITVHSLVTPLSYFMDRYNILLMSKDEKSTSFSGGNERSF
jgi:hypothetical protein